MLIQENCLGARWPLSLSLLCTLRLELGQLKAKLTCAVATTLKCDETSGAGSALTQMKTGGEKGVLEGDGDHKVDVVQSETRRRLR